MENGYLLCYKMCVIILIIMTLGFILFNTSYEFVYVSRYLQNHENGVYIQNQIYKDQSPIETVGHQNQHNKMFQILAWTGSYYGRDWDMSGSESFEMCEYKNCYGTTDRDLYNTSDAILIHMNRLYHAPVPQYRFPFQKWIMHALESPNHEATKPWILRFEHGYNATWTYNRNSDIWSNYSHGEGGGFFVKLNSTTDNTVEGKNYAEGKTKLAVWYVSKCNRPSRRMYYVKNLQKHIDVDIYGECGPFTCNRKEKTCLQMAEKEYKFYFAFENSLCDDYVTEKLWRAINMNIVPVVLGAYNYSELLPPKSYIDIKDYRSPELLAQHLKLLDRNDTLYNEYLQWKERYELVPHPPRQCNVCEYLNKSVNITKTYSNIGQFWDENTDCYTPTEFYKNVDASAWE